MPIPSTGVISIAFCLLNDQAIAARYLQDKHGINKVLIVDLDVHQGNGTAEIFRNDPSVFTFSMHGKTNYPFKKEISDLDIALDDQTNDETYLSYQIKNTHIRRTPQTYCISATLPSYLQDPLHNGSFTIYVVLM